jgi:hypothetical protein
MNGNDPALESRFTLFFDFLGASNAASVWPRERIHEFVDLLISIAQVQSAEIISGEAQGDGGYRLFVTPEITTFSDNVVVSYTGETKSDHPHLLDSIWTEIVCKDAIRILAGVAEMGLRIGLLIRGGLTFGQLYHQGGVVFGKALVDASSIEKQACYPRVVVSEHVISKLNHIQPQAMGTLLQDTDREWHLNYISEMVRQAAHPGPHTVDQAIRWKRAHIERIDAEIEELRRTAEPNASHRAVKWEWFKARFEAEIARVPN